MRRLAVLVALTACKASLGDGSEDAGGDATKITDAAGDALMLGPWGAPAPVGITPAGDDDPTATGDLLELYFNRASDIYVTTRASTSDPWGTPAAVTELNTTANETTPEVSYDGLTIYFASQRADAGTLGAYDIWMATRASRTAAWGAPSHVAALSSATADGSPASTDPLVMVLDSDRTGSALLDLYVATRATPTAAWGTPARISELASAQDDGNPMLAAGARTLYFDSLRSGDREVYVATRPTATAPFEAPRQIAELASAAADTDAWISPDERTLYFTSDRDGTQRLWQTTR